MHGSIAAKWNHIELDQPAGDNTETEEKKQEKKEKAHTAESEAGKLIEPVARAEADKKGGGRSEDERDIPLKWRIEKARIPDEMIEWWKELRRR